MIRIYKLNTNKIDTIWNGIRTNKIDSVISERKKSKGFNDSDVMGVDVN